MRLLLSAVGQDDRDLGENDPEVKEKDDEE
jgi:hypothetical protein